MLSQVRAKAQAAIARAEAAMAAQPNPAVAAALSARPAQAAVPSQAPPTPSPAPPTKQLQGLAKLVEYPGDEEEVQMLLTGGTVAPAGKDMYGLTALHKFAAWDKDALVEILLPYLSNEEVNLPSGREKQTPLHVIAEMGGTRVLKQLIAKRAASGLMLDLAARDVNGKTALELAVENGHTAVEALLRAAAGVVPVALS